MENNLINTSYPLNPNDWKIYKNDIDLFEKHKNELSLYIHIPFCKHLCKFCEYSKVKKNINIENKVIETIINDIDIFLTNHKISKLYGFDIGGGTPTCLEYKNFEKIINLSNKIIKTNNKNNDFIASIEATFDSIDDEKILLLKNSEFKRISFGIQILKEGFLKDNGRNSNLLLIKSVIEKLKKDFIINIDIMYGLNNVNKKDLKETIDFVNNLNINQITLYEMRYNMVNLETLKTREEIIDEYDYCYNLITNLGYIGNYGQNTFSKNKYDEGVSSYLKYRMNGYMYKGFGPSAQSMSNKGISYNKGKLEINENILINNTTYENGDIYDLPIEELICKILFISMYRCRLNLNILKKIYKYDFIKKNEHILKYLIQQNKISIQNNELIITKKGYKEYYKIVRELAININNHAINIK